MSDVLRSPWPGPRPFTGDESLLLESRDDELGEFGALLRKQKQVIQLSARSGVGKTSFLQAKLLPTLHRAGFVTLLYRDWAPAGITTGGRVGARELYQHAIGAAAADYELRTGMSLEAEDFPDVVDRLRAIANPADRTNPKVLIVFDQLEELLRRDPRLGRGFLDEVIRIARELPVKQILSLRSEYSEELLHVHRELGFLAEAMPMKELEGEKLRSVIVRPPQREPFGFEVTDAACDEILRWWERARDRQTEARGDSADSAEVNRLGVADVGLLHLQAVLWALYQDWLEFGADTKRIDLPDVIGFAQRLGRGPADADAPMLSEVAVLTESLLHWVDRALMIDDDDPDENRLLQLASDLTVPLAEQLSAGGYKTTAELGQLAKTCIGADLSKLGIEAAGVEPAVRRCLVALGRPDQPTGERYSVRLQKVADELDSMLRLTGKTMVKGRIAGHVYRTLREERKAKPGDGDQDHHLQRQALRHAGRELIGAFAVALFRLEAALVLREPPSVGGVRLLEIVHDGFGPALRLWSEERESTARSAVESVVAIGGEDLMWESLRKDDIPGGRADGVCWNGCWVSGVRGGRARIEGLTFFDSDFSGTVFDSVDFRDVTFDNCLLSGVLMRNCVFTAVRVTNGNISQLTFENVTGTDIELSRVFGNCLTFTDLGPGSWSLDRASLRLVLFDRSDSTTGDGEAVFEVRNSLMAHWQVDAGALAKLDVRESVLGFTTAEPTDRPGWVTLTDCEQIGSLLPRPILAAANGLIDLGGPVLDQDRPVLRKRPLGDDVDPWFAGRVFDES